MTTKIDDTDTDSNLPFIEGEDDMPDEEIPQVKAPAKKPALMVAATHPPEPGVDTQVLDDLARKTPPNEIKQRNAFKRDGSAAYNPDGTPLMLSYVDARYVQDVLDDVVGAAGWQTRFEDTHDGTRCGIGILVRGYGWVWKWDVGIPSNIEPVKGSHSDAFKRAAVQWGIARDLYDKADDAVDATNAPPPNLRQQVAVQQPARQQRYDGGAPQAAAAAVVEDTRNENEVEQDAIMLGIDWSCPIHNSYRTGRAGVTKQPPHRPYQARFYCGDPNCRERGPIVPVPA